MIEPKHLKSGDKVAIVSTARKISFEEVRRAVELLENWGLKPVLGKTIGAEENQFAGSDALRTKDFQHMLDDPEIEAIWCARGGYGTVRIIDKLDFSIFKKSPKWIIGFSDVTVLHSQIHSFGIETIHAQMPFNIEQKTEETRSSIKKILFGEKYDISFGAKQFNLNRPGKAKGRLVGGNLSILYSLCGSASALDTKEKILFLEDLDEYLYHIDRMMQNLKRNGMLENLAGLIVGGMTKMHDNEKPFGKTAEEIILETVSEYDFPVCFDFPSGHLGDNRALVFGREVEMDVRGSTINLQFSTTKKS